MLDYEFISGSPGVFSFDGQPATVPADSALTLTIDYTPTDAQSTHQATLRITSDDLYNWKVDVEISATSSSDEPVIETFTQVDAQPVDILLTFDDNPAMTDRLDALVERTEDMISWFRDAGIDAHIGVLDGDMTSPERGGALIGSFIDVAQAGAADTLRGAILQTTGGEPDHRYFDVIQAALSEPLASTRNAGFKRDGAALEIVAYSITDDSSDLNRWVSPTGSTPYPLRPRLVSRPYLRTDKRPSPMRRVLGLASLTSASPSAPSRKPVVNIGCSAMWVRTRSQPRCLLTVSGMQTEWALSQLVTHPEWIYVTVDGVDLDKADNANGWSYVSATNSVRFAGAGILPPEPTFRSPTLPA